MDQLNLTRATALTNASNIMAAALRAGSVESNYGPITLALADTFLTWLRVDDPFSPTATPQGLLNPEAAHPWSGIPANFREQTRINARVPSERLVPGEDFRPGGPANDETTLLPQVHRRAEYPDQAVFSNGGQRLCTCGDYWPCQKHEVPVKWADD